MNTTSQENRDITDKSASRNPVIWRRAAKAFIVLILIYLGSLWGMGFSARIDVRGVFDTVDFVFGVILRRLPEDPPKPTWNGLLFCGFWAAKCVSQLGMAWVLVRALYRFIRSPRGWEIVVKCVGISPNPSTGRLQFGIVTLLWMLLLASVLMSLYVVKLRPVLAQRAALAKLKPFQYDAEWVSGNVETLLVCDGTRKVDDSVIALLQPFRRLRLLILHGKQFTGTSLAELRGEELESLVLLSTSITDSALAGLEGMAKLEDLNISDTPVTDAGMHHILALPQLEILRLRNTVVSDEGLRTLSEHPNLKVLDLANTRITDEGLRHLADLSSLEGLHLEATSITDEGLRHLGGLNIQGLHLNGTRVTGVGLGRSRNMRSLDLGDTRTNDAALREVGLLEDLWGISLDGTDITDQGLEHLHGLKNLRYVDIENTAVSPSAVERLRRALPKGAILEAPPSPPMQASE